MPKKMLPNGNQPEDSAFKIWEMCNFADRWAQSPAALSPDELDHYLELCTNAHVDPTRLLYRFQQYYQELWMLQQERERIAARAAELRQQNDSTFAGLNSPTLHESIPAHAAKEDPQQ